jgi:IMP dehydrogenase/GMP reductase
MSQDKLLNFDDVLIEPQFSFVRSRKDVDVSTDFLGMKLSLPVMNSNMDTVASPELCRALAEYGAVGTLHRFWSIEENVKAFKDSFVNSIYQGPTAGVYPIVSIGIGDKEFERAKALHDVGANRFMLDVAHAANIAVVEMYNSLVEELEHCFFIVGDFGTSKEIEEFLRRVDVHPGAVKVGIGVGSVCKTRNVTGVGNTALSCLLDCSQVTEKEGIYLVLDGGVNEIGDISKALVAGADVIVSGSMFAGCTETPGDISFSRKEYRGSASLPSYKVQGKEAAWRAPEGTSILVDTKGPAIDVLNNINGGLRSSLSYVGAFNLNEFKAKAKFQYK